jgi:hypothetical protein
VRVLVSPTIINNIAQDHGHQTQSTARAQTPVTNTSPLFPGDDEYYSDDECENDKEISRLITENDSHIQASSQASSEDMKESDHDDTSETDLKFSLNPIEPPPDESTRRFRASILAMISLIKDYTKETPYPVYLQKEMEDRPISQSTFLFVC